MTQVISLNSHFVAEFEQLRARLQASEQQGAPTPIDHTELTRLREEAADFKSKWEEASGRLKSLESELNRARAEKADVDRQLEQERTRPATDSVQVKQLEAQLRSVIDERDELRGKIADLKQEAANCRRERTEAIEERTKSQDEFELLYIKYREMQDKYRDLQAAHKQMPKKV